MEVNKTNSIVKSCFKYIRNNKSSIFAYILCWTKTHEKKNYFIHHNMMLHVHSFWKLHEYFFIISSLIFKWMNGVCEYMKFMKSVIYEIQIWKLFK